MRNRDDRTATVNRPAQQHTHAPHQQQPPPLEHTHAPAVDNSGRKAQGIRDLCGGGLLIAIGLVMGGSVFTGDPSVLDWCFDILGTYWAVKGLYLLVT